jgi:imidazolonepropionase-like amidohydrolase
MPTIVPLRAPRCAAALLLGLGLGSSASALPQSHSLPQPLAVTDVRLSPAADAPRQTIVLRGGRIERILDAGAAVPSGVRIVEGKGAIAVPGFFDAFTQAGCAATSIKPQQDLPPNTRSDVQTDMREANRKGIAPAFRAADVFDLAADKSKGYRESGFGWLVSAPTGELLAGTSVLATSREAAARDQIVLPNAFAHGEFRASGGGYPGTSMGYVAQLRQVFLDAKRQRELELRYSQNRPGPRPPFDAELAAVRVLLAKERRLICAADSDLAIERWLKLADAEGFEIGVSGGRAAFELAPLLASRKIPVVLTLDWGDEPKDPHEKEKEAAKKAKAEKKPEGEKTAEKPPEPAADKPAEDKPAEPKAGEDKKKDEAKAWDYEEPLGVREEQRRRWEEGRDCAMALYAAGVPFAFGSGSNSPADLLKKVRTLVENGLPREVALSALCATPAQWLGLADHIGVLAPGKDATFALWTNDPLGKDTQVAWMFVDGFAHEFEVKPVKELSKEKPKEGLSASGRWELITQGRGGSRSSELTLEMDKDGAVTGKLKSKSPADDTESVSDASGRLSGTTLTIETKLVFGEREIALTLSGELSADEWSGESTTKSSFGENTSTFRATKKP